jgi:hypothetical protein
MGESQHPDPGSGMNNPDHIFLELRNHFFAFFGVDEDPGSGMNIPYVIFENLVSVYLVKKYLIF